jgi:hypothetical protein
MAESMFVRCEDCNYENLAQHSFCGMCGAKLPSPRRAAPPAVARPEPELQPVAAKLEPATSQQTMRGPSLLGLGTEPPPRERMDYLLDDEPSGGNLRRWLVIVVLAAAVGGAGWYWRSEIRGWMARGPQNPGTNANPTPPATAGSDAASSSTTSNPAPATPAPTTEVAAPSTTPAATSVPAAQPTTPATQAVTDAVARAPETKQPEQDSAANPPATQPAAAAVAPAPVQPKIERKAPAADASADALETQGENYLYGHGVPADCGRAGKNLLAAAARSNAKALSVLGTMYATGHCVTRDVPTAYRWFAKALHQDPGNVRIQRDLEVLWAQMTEEERKLAMQPGP